MTTQTKQVPAEFWGTDAWVGVQAELEVTRDECTPRIDISTFVNGEGSKTSFYLDRESAIMLARNILDAVALD